MTLVVEELPEVVLAAEEELVPAWLDDDIAGVVLDPISIVLSICLLYTSPSPRDRTRSRMPSSA